MGDDTRKESTSLGEDAGESWPRNGVYRPRCVFGYVPQMAGAVRDSGHGALDRLIRWVYQPAMPKVDVG